jgi:hypothetical protein
MLSFSELKLKLREKGVPERDLFLSGDVPSLLRVAQKHSVELPGVEIESLPVAQRPPPPESVAGAITARRMERSREREEARKQERLRSLPSYATAQVEIEQQQEPTPIPSSPELKGEVEALSTSIATARKAFSADPARKLNFADDDVDILAGEVTRRVINMALGGEVQQGATTDMAATGAVISFSAADMAAADEARAAAKVQALVRGRNVRRKSTVQTTEFAAAVEAAADSNSEEVEAAAVLQAVVRGRNARRKQLEGQPKEGDPAAAAAPVAVEPTETPPGASAVVVERGLVAEPELLTAPPQAWDRCLMCVGMGGRS